MKKELAEIQIQNHPLKSIMKKAVITMQNQVMELQEKLAGLKQNIIEGCKNAVAAFHEKGIIALNNIAGFSRLSQLLKWYVAIWIKMFNLLIR